MSLLSPTPGIPMWPLAMKGKEAISRASSATGRAMKKAGPKIDPRRRTRKITEAITSTEPITAEVFSCPGSRIATDSATIRKAMPTAPSRKVAVRLPSRSSSARPTSSEASRITPADRYVPAKAPKRADRIWSQAERGSKPLGADAVAPRLAALPAQGDELIHRVPPTQAAKDAPVGALPHRLDEAPPLSDPLAIAGDPAVGV